MKCYVYVYQFLGFATDPLKPRMYTRRLSSWTPSIGPTNFLLEFGIDEGWYRHKPIVISIVDNNPQTSIFNLDNSVATPFNKFKDVVLEYFSALYIPYKCVKENKGLVVPLSRIPLCSS